LALLRRKGNGIFIDVQHQPRSFWIAD
jgi:hypothetical protein